MPLRRQLLLAQLVRRWDRTDRGGSLSFAQYAALADSLAKVMDEVETQGCDLSKLKDLAPANLAEHWEGVSRFLELLREGLVDVVPPDIARWGISGARGSAVTAEAYCIM